MIILRSHLMLIAAVGMVSVLGLPVPDENDLSASPSTSMAIDILDARTSQGSINKRMDPNRLPPIDPDRLHGNFVPLPNPWRSHSGDLSNTPVSDLEIPENQQNPEKQPCVEPPVEMAGPDAHPWCKPRQAAEPVVSGPGGRFFRPIQEYQSEILFYQSPVAPDLLLNCNVGPSVVDKIKFIKGTSVGRRNLKDPNLYAVVRRQAIAPIENSIEKHEALPKKAVKWLNEYYILAQLVGTDEMKKQAQYFRTTEEYINSSGDARKEYNDCLERVEKKRPQVGDMFTVGLADKKGASFLDPTAYEEVHSNQRLPLNIRRSVTWM
ncbi:hypothetical protein EV360DRAFT_88608 [Lentinula raphanica]|nr:hypothetical protein EV360DRAFT_88608 [Lentinula raphanica]